MENINQNIKDSSNIENLISLYNNKITLKDKEIYFLKNKIKISQEKLDKERKENDLLKKQNYNYKMNNKKNLEQISQRMQIKDKSNINYKDRDKYISTIEEDNIKYIKNDLILKINSLYNKIFKLINKTNENIISEYNDIDNIDDLIELEKKLKFIESNINK